MSDRLFSAAYLALLLTVGLPFAIIAGIVFGTGFLGMWLVRRCLQ